MISNLNNFKLLARCLELNSGKKEVDQLRKDLISGDIVWEEVVGMANSFLLTPALWVALQAKNLQDDIPHELKEYLQELHSLNSQRNQKLKSQLLEAIATLNQVDVTPVLLKGSAYLLLDSFEDIGERIMYDLDILVPKSDLQKSIAALREIGYNADPETEIRMASHHHWAPLFRPGEFASIELHHDLMYHTAASILPTADVWQNVEPIILNGYSANVLSPTYRALHSILHSQIVDRYHVNHIINLRSLHDLNRLIEKDHNQIKWDHISRTMKEHGISKVLLSYLYSLHVLLRFQLPDGIQPNIVSQYHYLRSIASIRWKSVEKWERRIQRFSRYEIIRVYGCADRWSSVNMQRILHAKNAFNRWRAEISQ